MWFCHFSNYRPLSLFLDEIATLASEMNALFHCLFVCLLCALFDLPLLLLLWTYSGAVQLKELLAELTNIDHTHMYD